MISKEDLQFDQKHIWHPYTSLTNPLPTYPIASAKGVKLQLENGKELVDGMSSWWTAIHGYNVPALNLAAEHQLKNMAHVMFGGITHQPAIDLCKKLVDLTPKGLEKVFLADSGSVSVEVAMKMAIQYQHAKGQKSKTKFMTLRNGYHGDTTGAMSVCDPNGGMHHLFADFLPKHVFVEQPEKRFEEDCSTEDLQYLRDAFSKHAAECAAFILEPIVQGAGGMWFYAPAYLQEIRALCDQHQMLLIADEIATGFGRTGKLFACNHAAISPDILCLGKALTGGYMTLAATLTTDHVATTVCDGEAGVFMHGPTFMGNPLACAIANASLELLGEMNWSHRVATIESILKEELEKLNKENQVKDVRVLGAIAVVQMTAPIDVPAAQSFFVAHGVWIRPFRDLIYIMPPYVIERKELLQLTDVISAYVKKSTD